MPLIEGQRHELTVAVPAEALLVEADPTRLEQVLANLLNNAAKYTDPGGHIWLTAGAKAPRWCSRCATRGSASPPTFCLTFSICSCRAAGDWTAPGAASASA